MVVFGKQNAAITAVYARGSQDFDVFGSIDLTTPGAVNYRGWFEEVATESRQASGDTFARRAIYITDYREDDLDEGNVVTITPDQVGTETAQDVRKWRIERQNKFFGFVHGNKRKRRIELELVEQK